MSGPALNQRYELVRELGSGAMGQVFEAWDRDLERRVAVKLLPKGSHSELERGRFTREAKALARVLHPNVVAIFDVGVAEDAEPFIVMELLAGETLRDRLAREGKLSAEAMRAIYIETMMGLGAIHAAGLVHRDVKPANIMASRSAERESIKVLDLGVARATNEETLSQPGAIVGTVMYLAPEQIRGLEVDARADVYAAAVAMFELCHGKPPFSGPTVVEVLHAHLYDPIPKLSGAAPEWLAAILTRSLAKKPEERFQNAAEVERALRAGAAGAQPKLAARAAVATERAAAAPQPFAAPPVLTAPELLPELPALLADGEPSRPPDAAEPAAVAIVANPSQPADAPLELLVPEPAHSAPSQAEGAATVLEVDFATHGLAASANARTCAVCGSGFAQHIDRCPDCGSEFGRPPFALAVPWSAADAPLTPLHTPDPPLIVGFFSVVPPLIHLRVALGAAGLALAGYALLASLPWLLFWLGIAAFGAVGYAVTRKLS